MAVKTVKMIKQQPSVEEETTPKVSKGTLEKLVREINKKLGTSDEDQVMTLGFPKERKSYTLERIPTGSFSLDIALGGGIPVGRFTEISGAYSSTKTTQSLHIVKNAQKLGLMCAYIDVEGTVTESFAQSIGVDTSVLFYSKPDSLEEATQLILDLQRSGEVQLCVLDSIAALASNKEQSKEMDEKMQMGITQSLLGEFFRKYQMNNNYLDRKGLRCFTLIGLNQLREKIGAYGDPEYTPGGRAKGFTASVDLRLRRGDWISEGTGENKELVGQVVKFKVEKNKTYKRMQTGECDFYFSENNAGVPCYHNDYIKEIIMSAVAFGIIERKGAYFFYGEDRYQGIIKLTEALRTDEVLVDRIKEEVLRLSGVRNE